MTPDGRPQTPDPQLIGHEQARRLLWKLQARRKLPAAVLLAGPPHIGKRTLARAFAARLLDCVRDEDALTNPDLLRISPESETSSKDRMRDLLLRVAERPVTARYRVVLVEDIDRADRTAIPLLLKAIEDSPRFTRFLLTSAYPERLPATVGSRSLILTLARVPPETISAALRARGLPTSDAARAADLSGGRPGLALRLAADDALRAQYEGWDKVITGARALPSASMPFADTRENAEAFVLFLVNRVTGPRRASVLRRSREALAMLGQNVPAPLVLEYVLTSVP